MRNTILYCCLLSLTGLMAQPNFESTLPLLLIDTQGEGIPADDKIAARLEIIDNGPGQTNHPDDPAGDYDGWIGIELRGSSSLWFDKKGYAVETWDAEGEDLDASLLGLPEEEDWVLHGPYSDKSLLRNALLYDLAGEIMDWAPGVRMVEVIINDNYQGVYLLTERIKRDQNRVDINKLNEDEISGNGLTGGYILKFDKTTGEDFDDDPFFLSQFPADTEFEQDIRILHHYPKPDDLAPEQRTYIRDWIGNYESVLMGDDWLDPTTGYATQTDLESLADFFILNEVSRNVDAYRLSTYFYKQRDSDGGLLHFGPVWDNNLGFGNANYCNGQEIECWGFDFSAVCPEDPFQMPRWWTRFAEDPALWSLIRQKYSTLRLGILSDAAVTGRIDSFVNLMGAAPDRNFDRWPILGEYVWPNAFIGNTYDEEVEHLANWALARLAWLDGQWLLETSVRPITEGPAPVAIYPNPGPSTELRFAISDPELRPTTLRLVIRNTLGRVVHQSRLCEDFKPLATPPSLPGGWYAVNLLDPGGNLVVSLPWIVR